tara:strand:- start:6902 stop:7516 length:615 start_codon:yes stop_codon:yes gene_type:complete
MTLLEVFAIVGGLLIGYVIVWAFIGRKKEKPSVDSGNAERSGNSNQYRSSEQSEESIFHEYRPDGYGEAATKEEVRIFSCPSCKQRIRVTLPLPGGVGKCAKCNGRFGISIDDNGTLYITGINNSQNNYNSSISTIGECFTILGLIEGASSEDIKSAYRRKMKEYHPDKVAHLGEKLRSIADIETKRLNTAYAILKDAGYVSNA